MPCSKDEEDAREWNKTADGGPTCKSCGRVFFLKDAKQHGQKWEEHNGEPWLVEVKLACPHCNEIRPYHSKDLELHQLADDGLRRPPE